MKLIIIQQAKFELFDAVDYYEDKQAGLGSKLLEEVKLHIQWINKNPQIPRLRQNSYRRVNLKVFPFYIPYLIRGITIWVLAIANSHRSPEYWINRTEED